MELLGRRRERAVLDRLVQAVRGGESWALVLGGEPGIGKTALLDYVAGHAAGCRVIRAAGVQSEMELAFAGLHQLCGPMLGRLDRLPPPQADALRVAFGVASGSAPDRFLVGLAVLLAGDARDDRRELFDLETQGAGPGTLRRHLRLRAVLVAGLGLLGGLAAAALLAILAVDLVTLTAGASVPEPPLAIAVDWRLVALACAVYAVLTAGLVALAARRAV